jgi:hypothetical protein
VQIYSGTKAGPVSIEACTIPLPPDSLFVCDEKSLITISSGPPFHVEASPTPAGEATNPSYPERFVQVGAGVWDVYANPVEYGTAVYFSLIPNNIAEVEGNSYTGLIILIRLTGGHSRVLFTGATAHSTPCS